MRFILGASGSGKTTFAYKNCIEEAIKNPEKTYIILVPEQYSMQTQKNIVQLHPFHATDNIDVLSFNRLAYRIFTELGIVTPGVLDDIAKVMIIRKLSMERSKELGVWKNQFSKTGFIDNIKSMISELYQYDISSEKIAAITQNENISTSLRHKLKDLNLMYESFTKYTKDKYISTEEIPDILVKHIKQSSFIKDSIILLDGFTGFTPIQYKLIEELLKYSEDLICTVTIGSGENIKEEGDESDLFGMSKVMHEKILELCKRAAVQNIEYTDLNNVSFLKDSDFVKSKAIDHIEKYFLRYKPYTRIDSEGDISIVRAANIDEEVDMTVSEILHLVKEKGLRYKDITILCADMSSYIDKFKHKCKLNDIPVFIDDNISISSNILVEFVRACLGVVREEFSYTSVMRYIRSPLIDMDYSTLAAIDDYMYICGIKGLSKIKKAWEHIPRQLSSIDIDELNSAKNIIVEDLEPLYKLLKSRSADTGKVIAELKRLIKSKDAEVKMIELSKEFEKDKDPAHAREYEKVYEELIGLLDKTDDLLGNEKLSGRELYELLEAGFGQISVGMIPKKLDRIFFGDLKRSRIDRVRALFVVGANDGIIPKLKQSDSILNDREKESLKSQGIELSATAKEDLVIQRYYLYMNMTKSFEYLSVSYSSLDNLGKSLKPSYIIAMLAGLFTDVKVENAAKLLKIYSKEGLKEAFIRDITALKKGEFELEDESLKDIELRSIYKLTDKKTFEKAYLYADKESALGKAVALELFKREIKGSVTSLEKYVDCPYAYFVRYGLGLEERRAYGLEAVDIGVFIHSVIERFFNISSKHNLDLKNLDNDRIYVNVETVVKELMLLPEFAIYADSNKQRYSLSRLENMAKQSIVILLEQIKLGNFLPLWNEKSFSYKEGLSSLNIDLSDSERLKLSGKIDRVDICELQDKVLVKIIDYKTGSTKWETDLVYYGKQIQLVSYLDVIMELLQKRYPGKEIVPAAFMYINIDEPIISMEDIKSKEDIEKARLNYFRPSGIVNTDLEIIKNLDTNISSYSDVIPVSLKDGVVQDYRSSTASSERIKALRNFVKNKSIEIAQNILKGNISISPSQRGNYTACDYCEYSAMCGFDKKNGNHNYNVLEKMKDELVWEKILNDEKMD